MAAASRRSSSCWIKAGSFEQADHLGPDDLIEQFLSNEATIVANGATQFPPAIGANALVVMNFSVRWFASRCSRQRRSHTSHNRRALCTTLGAMVRRSDRILLWDSSSWARAKVSSVTRAGTGISIHSSRGRWWPAVWPGVAIPRRRCGRVCVRGERRVLPKQATPR